MHQRDLSRKHRPAHVSLVLVVCQCLRMCVIHDGGRGRYLCYIMTNKWDLNAQL